MKVSFDRRGQDIIDWKDFNDNQPIIVRQIAIFRRFCARRHGMLVKEILDPCHICGEPFTCCTDSYRLWRRLRFER